MGELGSLHSNANMNVDSIHEKNAQGGGGAPLVMQDITGVINDLESFDLSAFDPLKPVFISLTYINVTASNIVKAEDFFLINARTADPLYSFGMAISLTINPDARGNLFFEFTVDKDVPSDTWSYSGFETCHSCYLYQY